MNEERQNKQRLESQVKTEKILTKKLQDDLTKLSLTPTKFVLLFYNKNKHFPSFIEMNVQNNVSKENVISRMKHVKYVD